MHKSKAGEPFGWFARADPDLRVFLPDGVLLPGQSTVQTLRFKVLPQVPGGTC